VCRQRELSNLASRGDPTDLACLFLCEPEIAIGTSRDPEGHTYRCRNRELGDIPSLGVRSLGDETNKRREEKETTP
jgi:hypothetical protein